MNCSLRLLAFILLASACAPLAQAQNTIFNDSLTSDALNTAVYPAVTPTSTGWDVLTNKSSPAPTMADGTVTINMAGTTSGFAETEALFASAPVQLLPGTYIELITTFIPTSILTTSSDNLIFGLFNSGGSAPLNGLLNSGLSNALTTFITGGAKGWVGYNANIPLTGGAPRMFTRPAQTGANNTIQDVVVGTQSTSVGYTTPSGVSATSVTAFSTTLTSGSTYTLDYKLSLSADGLTLTANVSLYNGTGTLGTGVNSLIGTYSGRYTGSTLLTKSFDALAFGWRADAGASSPSNFKIAGLTVMTTGGAPWFITQPPTAIAVSIGSSLSLNTSVGGTVDSYQWQVSTDGGSTFANINSMLNPSAATASFNIASVQNSDAGTYRLVATNAAGSITSANCVVSVSASAVAPSISTDPVGATILGGTPFTFTATVNGTSPLSYQWEMSPDGVSFLPISGSTGASYTIPSVSLTDEGYYRLTVTNVAGSATSAAARLDVNQPLTVTVQPLGSSLNLGGSYTLSVTAVGKPAPTYQWYLNGVAIPSATNSTYTIASASGANGGIYTAVATNTAGDSVTSAGAVVTVLSPSLAVSTLTPSTSAAGVFPDVRLKLTFNQPIAVGLAGKLMIFDSSNPTTPIDTIDLLTANSLMKTLRAGSTVSTLALPVQNMTVGGLTNFNYYPVTISGNTATIYPRNNVLTYGKSYFVTIDPGFFTDTSGLSYGGIAANTGWAFSTKNAGPASDATQLVVAADGSGDFMTVQGALDFIPAANTTARTIFIRKGTYFEEIYFTAKHSLLFLGEDRTQSIIAYPNNNNFNNVSGSYHRMVFQADKANNAAFINLTVQNTTPKGGSQAEALILNGTTTAQGIISNVNLVSFQDTLQVNGQAYVADSHISGDVDYMWGGGPCFFYNSELTMLSSGAYFTQIRNGSAGHGFVYLNCTLDAAPGISGSFLARIDPGVSGGFPFSEVVWLNSVMGLFNGTSYSTPVDPTGWLLNNTSDQSAASAPNVHFWEYNSHYSDGTPINVSSRIGASKQLTLASDAATIANYSTPSFVLGNSWTPKLAPTIATAPVAQTTNAGSGFTLSVQAFGIPALTYQWLLNGAPIPGATAASYSGGSASAADAGTYSVIVSNGTTSVTTSAVPLVIHGAAPVITLPPGNTAALLGTTATFNAVATGDGPFTYQWFKGGAPISGATKLSLRLTNLQMSDAGSYAVAITNAGGTTTSASAALTIAMPVASLPTQPHIPSRVFYVTDFGAVGDGATDNTAAIQATFNAAKAAGGGTVEFTPASGAYLTGPITVPSFTDFQVDAGAIMRALPFGTYPRSSSSPAHFITIDSAATDVEFSGGGTIDGDGAAWWALFNAGTISARPRLVQITKSTNMLFSGITFLNSPNFHLAFSGANTNVTIFGVTIRAPGDSPNTDGMDIAGSNFLIQSCSVSDGDDNIVAKPGSVFCTNFVISNCTFGTGHGLSIGGQTNVGLDGMTVTDCTFNGTDVGLRLKADATQGGPVQHVSFSNLTMTGVTYPILFYSYYNQLGSPGAVSGSSQITPAKVLALNAAPPNPLGVSTVPGWKNITIQNLTATGAGGYSMIWGVPLADGLIQNVTLKNVNIIGGAGFEIYDATNVQFLGTNTVGPFVTANSLGITSEPVDQSITGGGNASFSVTAVGTSGINSTAPKYQWTRNGVALTEGTQPDGAVIVGSTSSKVTITGGGVAEAGSYACTVSNTLDGYNTATSAIVANSLPVFATSSAATLAVSETYLTYLAHAGLDIAGNGAPTADPDNDGMSNLLEFILGGNPIANDAASVAPTSTTSVVGGHPVLVYEFNHNLNALSATYSVEYSTDLVTWTTAANGVNGVTLSISPVNISTEHVIAIIPAVSDKVFARIHVSLP